MYRSGRCFALSRTAPQASACSGRARSSKGNGIRVSPYRRAIEFWKARGRPASRRTSFHRRCACPAPPTFNGTVVTVAPMAKKDAVSKRLAEEIALAKRIKNRIKDPPSLSLLDLANPDEKEKLAASLWLDEKDPLLVAPILDAFKAFGLDHRSFGDWYQLAAHLARVLFARRRPGRSKKWTDERLCLLLADVAAYKRKNPKAFDPEICGWLHLHKKSYAHESSEALRRALQDARNRKRNSDLASMADFVARTATGNWTTALDETATVKAVSWVIENADELWGPRK
jgi:hypothetical protein